MRLTSPLSRKAYSFILLLVGMMLACNGGQRSADLTAALTRTPLPTFTATSIPQLLSTSTPTPLLPDMPAPVPITDTPSPTASPSPTETPTATPTDTPLPPPNTAIPLPTNTPTVTPSPEPVIKYVIAGAQREFNCDFTYIYGTVKNANNLGIPDVEVRALGIHDTIGLDFITHTDAEGRYEIFRVPLPDLQAAQWAIMLMENGGEVSERFHWASTPVCESDDAGHSQVLRVDWKLIE